MDIENYYQENKDKNLHLSNWEIESLVDRYEWVVRDPIYKSFCEAIEEEFDEFGFCEGQDSALFESGTETLLKRHGIYLLFNPKKKYDLEDLVTFF